MSLFRHILIPMVVAILIFVATCLLTFTNVPSLPRVIPWDKVAHFGMFFVLSAVSLYDYYLYSNKKPNRRAWIFWGVVVPIIYGVIIELLQKYLFTYRSGEFMDVVANSLGSLAALLLMSILLKPKKSYNQLTEK